MSFLSNLTPKGKIFFGVVALLLIGGGLYYGHTKLKESGKLDEIGETGPKIVVSEDADLVIAYNTFPGVEGLLYMNGGMEPSEASRIYKEFGIKVQIKQMDVVNDTREGLKSGKLDAVYCTTDALPIEMSSGSELLEMKVKQIMKVNESRGADALVVTKGISKVSDLKGKKVAYAIGTASNTLLINLLETSGLTVKDINAYKVADGVEAANAFRNGQCDAAVVWAPDDEDCKIAVTGSKILVTTATATSIIADGLLVTEANLKNKRATFVKLVKAWLKGNGELNVNNNAKKEANKLFAEGFSFPEDVAGLSANKIRFSTLGDNKRFFGLETTFTGVTGQKMYSRMAVKYTEANLAKSPARWEIVSDESVIEEILGDNSFASNNLQAAESDVVFAPATEREAKAEASGEKTVTITFPTASSELDDQSKVLIDREITGVAQSFTNARIRVEGNTDNVGNPVSNKNLSLRRAASVVNYLVNEHHFDRNKFIVVGNGQDKPVATNSNEDGRSQNRRTDFQFIW